jgi:hypothetical protein
VFQIGGAGSVGTASLRGMPALHRLRLAGFAIWPFDPPRYPLAVELWPRLLTGPVVKSNLAARRAWLAANRLPLTPGQRARAERSEDAFDAAVAACRAPAPWAEPAWRVEPTDPVVQLEGWIWGVPLPGR